MAGTTGLEPAASAVTGQRSNQLNYVPTRQINWSKEPFLGCACRANSAPWPCTGYDPQTPRVEIAQTCKKNMKLAKTLRQNHPISFGNNAKGFPRTIALSKRLFHKPSTKPFEDDRQNQLICRPPASGMRRIASERVFVLNCQHDRGTSTEQATIPLRSVRRRLVRDSFGFDRISGLAYICIHSASRVAYKGVLAMTRVEGYRKPCPGTQPGLLHSPYVSSIHRAPTKPLVPIPHTLSEVTGPSFAPEILASETCDLTADHKGDPIGERIYVSGRVLDENGRPMAGTLVEVWQANAAGRYLHEADQHAAPLDPNFTGCGRAMTDSEGRYRFLTIRPGEYPWRNHYNGWRAAHIHFSIFGPAFATRLVTQMFFPGDPLLPYDPIFNCTADEKARNRLISTLDWETTVPEYALGYQFNIVLRGREGTPMEE